MVADGITRLTAASSPFEEAIAQIQALSLSNPSALTQLLL